MIGFRVRETPTTPIARAIMGRRPPGFSWLFAIGELVSSPMANEVTATRQPHTVGLALIYSLTLPTLALTNWRAIFLGVSQVDVVCWKPQWKLKAASRT